jgi:hypothetical protein
MSLNMIKQYSIIAKMQHYDLDAYRYFRDAPSHEKHALVQTIKNTSLELLKKFIECIKYTKKATRLKEADMIHEELKYLWLLYYELGYLGTKGKDASEKRKLNDHRFKVINQDLDEIGRMMGGWIKSVNDKDLKTVSSDEMIEKLLNE